MTQHEYINLVNEAKQRSYEYYVLVNTIGLFGIAALGLIAGGVVK